MTYIRIFTPSIDFLGEISDYESLFFVRSFNSIGELDLRINRYKKYTDTLQKGNVIVIGKQMHKAYRILHREIELDENGKVTENWFVRAEELKSVTSQRITLPPARIAYDRKNDNAESVIKHYVKNNLINPIDHRRKIEQLIIADNLNRGQHIEWQSRFKVVSEELEKISLISGIGWHVSVDDKLKKWVLDVYGGRDLSVNQEVNSPVIFSPQFDNIKNMQFVDSDLNYKNTAYVAGQGEGTERRVVELGEASGLERLEIFVDARDVEEETDEEEPKPRPPKDIIRDLTNRGEQKLAEMIQEIFLEAQILTPVKNVDIEKKNYFLTQFQTVEKIKVTESIAAPFVYEKDWDLGDIVTLQNKDWGITLDTRITEVTEIYERDIGFRLEVTFGQKRPDLISKIKQELSGMKTEMTR